MHLGKAALWATILSSLAGCTRGDATREPAKPAVEVTNRIAVPPEVVSNIGITFERARRGRLAHWLQVSGRLVVPEDRRWTIRAPAEGRVRPRVRVGDSVDAGDVLAVLESPALFELQRSILTARSVAENTAKEAESARERLDEAEALRSDAARLQEEADRRRIRIRELLDGNDDPESSLSSKVVVEAETAFVEARSRTLEAAVFRDDLRTRSRRMELEVTRARLELDQRFVALSVLTGLDLASLRAVADGSPVWQSLVRLEIRSPGPGIVTSVEIADGEHVAEGQPLFEVTDPATLAFRGYVPESDLDDLTPGAPVRVESAGTRDTPLETRLWDSPPAYDEETRSVLVRAWVENEDRRIPPGISATAHILISRSTGEEVLLRADCVVFDGLEAVVFRRDPSDPNVVIRTPVELGARSAETVEVLAGVLDGDEVVRRGARQLQQTGIGRSPQGGHFHADGTWHEEH